MDTEIDVTAVRTKKTHQKSKVQDSSRKPGGKIIRGCGRGGISRASTNSSSTSAVCILPYNLRGALHMTNLTISNLDDNITESDVMEVFGKFGPLKFVKVHRDEAGKSIGCADVLFEKHANAVEAMKKYNGVEINGRQISIQLNKFGPNSKKVRSSSSSTKKSTNGVQKKRKRKSHRKQKMIPLDEELIAELQVCMTSKLNIGGA